MNPFSTVELVLCVSLIEPGTDKVEPIAMRVESKAFGWRPADPKIREHGLGSPERGACW
jgi:hypothetical protein